MLLKNVWLRLGHVLIGILLPILSLGKAPMMTLADPDDHWSANWIAAAYPTGTEYGIYYFRKMVTLASTPSTFKVHVSADNRYKLYVNQILVSMDRLEVTCMPGNMKR